MTSCSREAESLGVQQAIKRMKTPHATMLQDEAQERVARVAELPTEPTVADEVEAPKAMSEACDVSFFAGNGPSPFRRRKLPISPVLLGQVRTGKCSTSLAQHDVSAVGAAPA